MRKILILLLVFIISIFPNLNVEADELPTLKVGSCHAYKNEIITIPITLKNNPGFNYLGAKIRYDSSKLEYKSSKIKGLTSATMKGIEINSHKTVTLYALTSNDTLIKDNGKIAQIEFEVLDDSIDEIPIEVEIDNYGKDKEDIEIKKVDGLVSLANHGNKGSSNDLSNEVKKSNKEQKITWKSSDKKVAIVDQNGKVTFKDNGNVKIQAIDEDDNIVLDKDYKIDAKVPKNLGSNESDYSIPLIILGIVILVFTIVVLIIYFKKKKNK